MKNDKKSYYDVKVECLLPATLTYRVLAKDAEEAVNNVKYMSPNGVKHKIAGKKDLKITVYDSGTSMIRFFKNILGGLFV